MIGMGSEIQYSVIEPHMLKVEAKCSEQALCFRYTFLAEGFSSSLQSSPCSRSAQ